MIGLTTYLQRAQTGVWDVTASFLPGVYIDAVTRVGGTVVLLPPQPIGDDTIARVLDGLDGLIVTGGRDIEPARYGQEASEHADPPSPIRDEWEEQLLVAAIDRELPFLGICRGLQVLNVARGGTLLQHLPDVVGSDRYNAGEGKFTPNEATVEADTALASLVGAGSITGKSYHHQAVDDLGEGLAVSARTDDGTVYAVELPEVPFGLAVQWHPEEDAAEDARLFEGLVTAARDYAARTESKARA